MVSGLGRRLPHIPGSGFHLGFRFSAGLVMVAFLSLALSPRLHAAAARRGVPVPSWSHPDTRNNACPLIVDGVAYSLHSKVYFLHCKNLSSLDEKMFDDISISGK